MAPSGDNGAAGASGEEERVSGYGDGGPGPRLRFGLGGFDVMGVSLEGRRGRGGRGADAWGRRRTAKALAQDGDGQEKKTGDEDEDGSPTEPEGGDSRVFRKRKGWRIRRRIRETRDCCKHALAEYKTHAGKEKNEEP